jgi:Tol biopolymer transport system component
MGSSPFRLRVLPSLLALTALLAGCGGPRVSDIAPVPDVAAGRDLGLGPGVEAVSSGPGDKGSPSWNPTGERIAYTVDGYVVDRPVDEGKPRRLTTRDFGAEEVSWVSEHDLAVFGTELSAGEDSSVARSLYQTSKGSSDGSYGVERISARALSVTPGPEGEGTLVALQTGSSESALALIGGDGRAKRIYTSRIEGTITGLSLSPGGENAVVAALQDDGTPTSYTLHLFDLGEGEFGDPVRLEEGLEVFGSPQWTSGGIYYAAGEEGGEELYSLYRVTEGSEEPEIVGGEEFAAFGLRASPDGESLAVIGRRSAGSPTNLYLMEPASGELEALTSNEDMEVKTGPNDLAWSRDGRRIALVARGVLPGVRVYPGRADALLADFYNVYAVEASP